MQQTAASPSHEEIAQAETQNNKIFKPLPIYEKRITKNKKKIWTKDAQVNFVRPDAKTLDDFFALKGSQSHKVKKVTVMLQMYVSGVKFDYQLLDQKTPAEESIVEGYPLTGNPNPPKSQQSFDLEDDEYVTRLFGRRGIVIDQFGFSTNKGRSFKFGGEGGSPFESKAPQGYHYATFAVNAGSDVNCVFADIQAIPNTTEIKSYPNFNEKKFFELRIGLMVAEYLTVSDLTRLFLVSRSFSLLRFDEYIISQISRKCIFGGQIAPINYVQKLLRHSGIPQHQKFAQINELLQISQNRIENCDSQLQFQGWKITQNGGDGIQATGKYFDTSFAYSEIMFERKFTEIFDEKVISEIRDDKACIVAGANFRDSGYGGDARCVLEIVDSKQKKPFFEKTAQSHQLQTTGTHMGICFRNTDKNQDLYLLRFRVGGKDRSYSYDYVRPKISQIYLRCLPLRDVYERQLLEQMYLQNK